MQSYAHFHKLQEQEKLDVLPGANFFSTADEFFADAFAKHVGNSAIDARYFTAGWLHQGREARDLRDTVARLDRLSPPAARLAAEALASAWGVNGRKAFCNVLHDLARGVPESHLQPALEGLAQALAHVPNVRRYRAIVEELQRRITMRTSQGQAAWAQAAGTLGLDRPGQEDAPSIDEPWMKAGKRKRDTPRADFQDGDARSSSSSSSSEASSESPGNSAASSPELRWAPGPQATEAEILSFILSVMQPSPPSPASPPPASAQDQACPATPTRSPARKKGAVIPRARSPKA